jgi:transglutaminase-like putative cysteine protease
MVLTWALVLVINQYYGLRAHTLMGAFYAIVPALIIYLFDINKKNVISYLLLGSLVPFIALIFWVKKINPINWINDLIYWCSIYNGSEELYAPHHAKFLIFAIACAGALIFYILTRKQLAKAILAVVIMTAMIIMSISKVDINKAVVSICIFYILTILVELNGFIYSKKTGKPEKKEGILYLAPICFIIALLAILLPSKPEPLEWRAVRYVYNNIKDQIEVWKTDLDYYLGKSSSEFAINLTGYSEDSGELESEGSLIKDSKIALRISGLDKHKSVYLTGSVSNIYTGSSWEKSRLGYLEGEQEYFLDYVELFFALSRQDLEVLQNNRFVERKALKIIYNNIKTKTFFYPAKTSWYDILSGYDKINFEAGQINFIKARGRGTTYQSIFYEMNYKGEAFIQMLKEADTFSYDTEIIMEQEAMDYVQYTALLHDNRSDIQLNEDIFKILGERADMIKSQYTTLPEDLPDRVRELAEEITSEYDTTYDKLKAIEEYLMGYTYSLTTKKIPEDADFIDYFLFESKQGYCTSYATAMAVLGRCIGIPTRYVEGFMAKFDLRDDESMYLVKNSQAHAWAEAYMEGVGWIPFEATPPFYENRYTQWTEPAKPGNTASTEAVNPYENYISEQEQGGFQQEEFIVVLEEEDNSAEVFGGFIIFLSAIAVLLIILVIYYYVLKYRDKKEYEVADSSKKMYMLFLRILRHLKREGFMLDGQETILMLSQRVRDEIHFDTVTFPVVANIFMRYRYADEEVTMEELEQVALYHTGLSNKEREEESMLRVWLEEFLFLARRSNH